MRLVRHLPEFIKKPWRLLQERRRAKCPFWSTYGTDAPLSFLDPRIVINHERRYVYIRVPKAANSTVVASLYASDTGQVIEGGGLFHAKNRHFAHPSQLNSSQVKALDGYTAFTIVRNPVKRLLSAYRNKVARKKQQSLLVFRALGRDPANSEITLEDFVGYLEDGGLMADPHWMPQRFFLPKGFRPLDFTGKVELLSEDLPRILARLYPEGFKVVDYRPHATGASKAVIDAKISERIAALYAEDYPVFGYER